MAQGVDVPWCYGFYRFDMPWGEEVTGILLEDLSDPSRAQTIETCIQACRPKTVEADIEDFDSLVRWKGLRGLIFGYKSSSEGSS